MRFIIILLVILMVIFIFYLLYNKNLKEGFWSWNYRYGTPCVEDVFGNINCDPSFLYLYPNYYNLTNPFLYSAPEVIYRRINRILL